MDKTTKIGIGSGTLLRNGELGKAFGNRFNHFHFASALVHCNLNLFK